MNLFRKVIFTGFAPNLGLADTRLAIKLLFTPTQWRIGDSQARAQNWLRTFFGVPDIYLCDSGRSALTLALEAIGILPGDEVLVQAFTCLVVINSIRAVGARPIYIDIDRDFNLNPADAAKKITSRTRTMIIQHTFGVPARLNELITLAKTRQLTVIEDCAHALGGTRAGKKLGTIGEIGIFSFGSDKVISCARGGAIIVNNQSLAPAIQNLIEKLPATKYRRIVQHLLHYPVFYAGKLFYQVAIGKAILWLAKKFHLINLIIYPEEKRGEPMRYYPSQLPNALATILLPQLDKLNLIIEYRRLVARAYEDGISNPRLVLPLKETAEPVVTGVIYLRYPLLVENPQRLYEHMKNHNILLGNWYDAVVSPCLNGCSFIDYTPGSCPTAERVTKQIVNLPTDIAIGDEDITRIIDALNSYRG